MVSRSIPSSPRIVSPCSLNSGAAGGAPVLAELHRRGHQLEGNAVAVWHSCMYPLAMLCGSTAASSVSCTTHHWPVKSASRSRHSASVAVGERRLGQGSGSVLLPAARHGRRTGHRWPAPDADRLAELGQYRLACRQQKDSERSSLVR